MKFWALLFEGGLLEVRGVAPSKAVCRSSRRHLRARVHRLGRGVLIYMALRECKGLGAPASLFRRGRLVTGLFRAALQYHSLYLRSLQSLGQARRRDTGPPSSHGGTHLDRVDTDVIGVCAVDRCDAVDLYDSCIFSQSDGGLQIASSVHHRGIGSVQIDLPGNSFLWVLEIYVNGAYHLRAEWLHGFLVSVGRLSS